VIDIEFPTTTELPQASLYEPVTWAYDLLNPAEKRMMVDECKRLKRHDVAPIVYWWDSRGSKAKTRVQADKVTRKQSVFGEIWKEL